MGLDQIHWDEGGEHPPRWGGSSPSSHSLVLAQMRSQNPDFSRFYAKMGPKTPILADFMPKWGAGPLKRVLDHSKRAIFTIKTGYFTTKKWLFYHQKWLFTTKNGYFTTKRHPITPHGRHPITPWTAPHGRHPPMDGTHGRHPCTQAPHGRHMYALDHDDGTCTPGPR